MGVSYLPSVFTVVLIIAVIVVFVVVDKRNHRNLAVGVAISVSSCVGGPCVKPGVVAVLVHVLGGIVVVVFSVVVFVFPVLAVGCVSGVVAVVFCV